MSDASAGKYAPKPGNIPGVPINLGGVSFVLAPLGLKATREMIERGKAAKTEDENIAFGMWMIQQSLVRNYPDITLEDVEALIDTENMREATEAITGTSGLKRVTPGELAPRG